MGQRRRQWANNKTALAQRLVLAGNPCYQLTMCERNVDNTYIFIIMIILFSYTYGMYATNERNVNNVDIYSIFLYSIRVNPKREENVQ